ncbi:hypothetical protein CCYA_CCYA04G1278 [Cyanidiococcus yangmingshanensis]|nr:hypothetical protein CCYA_CCYA04G1278 [Cyanidiococcus yangmingshanensis]
MFPEYTDETVNSSSDSTASVGEETNAPATSSDSDSVKLLVTLSATDVPLDPKRYLEYLFMRWLFLPETTAWIEQALEKLSSVGKISEEDVALASPKPTTMRQERLASPTCSTCAAISPNASRKLSISETPAPNSPAAVARSALHRVVNRAGTNHNGAEARSSTLDRWAGTSGEEAWTASSPQSPISLFIRSHAVFPFWSPADEISTSEMRIPHDNDDCLGEASLQDCSIGDQHPTPTESSPWGQSSTTLLDSCDRDGKSPQNDAFRRRTSATTQLFPPSSSKTPAGAIPRFYYPDGRMRDEVLRTAEERQAIRTAFDTHEGTLGQREIIELIMDIIGLPSFVSLVIFERLLQRQQLSNVLDLDEETENDSAMNNGRRRSTTTDDQIDETVFMQWYMDDCAGYDRHARLFHALQRSKETRSSATSRADTDASDGGTQSSDTTPCGVHSDAPWPRNELTGDQARHTGATSRRRCFLTTADFRPFIDALLATHPGLQFLQSTPEFQHRYAETVIERIFYYLNRPDGRAYLADLRRRRLLDIFKRVDEEEDINLERACFSYEHFYVIYCRFWELDTDHDLMIDREDLLRYSGHALTYRIIDCVFSGRGRPLDCARPEHMSYTDFVWFILSEEDKNSDTALDYWFRCIDADGDGQITLYDIDWLYSEQLHRMECLGHEPVAFEDILCQLLDMISKDADPPVVTRSALRASRMQSHFFNVLFNLNKFIAIESRDPVLLRQERATPDLSDWDRFAALEYLRLSAEDDEASMDAWNAAELEGMYSASSISGVESPF